jgi:pilus assembly protein CpaD
MSNVFMNRIELMADSVSSNSNRIPRLVRSLGSAVLLASALAGCNATSNQTTGSIPMDYRQRHPIALVQGNQTLDVFTGRQARGLDSRQLEDVRAFARDYMKNGEGPLIAYLPVNGGHGVRNGLDGIRHALSSGGASGRLQIAQYHAEAGNEAPIRLAFAKLQAQVSSHCGYEFDEVVPTNFHDNITNAPSRNFGCAYQRNLAAQVNDPRDFVRPRQEGPVDSSKRLAGIEKLRKADGSNELKPTGTSVKETLSR